MGTFAFRGQPESRNFKCLRQVVDLRANGFGKPEPLTGTSNRFRAKAQRPQFPADFFGCRLAALTAPRPNRIHDVSQFTAEDLRSPLAVAAKKQAFQNSGDELGRGIKL